MPENPRHGVNASGQDASLGLVVRVRHEVADVAVLRPRRGRQHLLFCQQYPTGKCASGNGGCQAPGTTYPPPSGGRLRREPTPRLPASTRSGTRIGWTGQCSVKPR